MTSFGRTIEEMHYAKTSDLDMMAGARAKDAKIIMSAGAFYSFKEFAARVYLADDREFHLITYEGVETITGPNSEHFRAEASPDCTEALHGSAEAEVQLG